ncbi:trigger factor [Patescibacteria group bacterium]|nr:trigger factor [Patescibacteria group bacterium]
METRIQKLPKSEIEMEVEISPEEFQTFIEKAISDLSKNIKIDGFRQGKVPKDIIEREIGTDGIFKEAGDQAVKEKYLQAIAENKVEPISSPEISILKLSPGNPFIFKARFSILPKLSLPDYKKIASLVKKREIQVGEEEIKKALLELQKSRAKLSQIAVPAKKGNFVEIEFSSPQIEIGKAHKDGFLLGDGRLIPGFEEKLEGMAAGDEKSFSLKFPAKHSQQNLTNQETHFKVKMESVKKMELPEINEQFAQSLGKFESVPALKQSILEGIKLEKTHLEKQRTREEILRKINNEISMEIPEVLLDAEKNRQLEELKNYVDSQLKISFKEYSQRINKSENEIKDSFPAKERIQNFLVLKKIAQAENIEVTDEEIEAEINKVLKQYPSKEGAKKELDLAKLKSYYGEAIKNEKVFQLLENLIQK